MIIRNVRFGLYSVVLCLSMVLLGCKGGNWGFDPVNARRSISMYTFGLNWPEVEEEFPGYYQGDLIGFRVYVGGTLDENMVSIAELAGKVEVNPGDGTGWLDFTNAWQETAESNGENTARTHAFLEPGEYPLRLRVTYWDGEVLTYNSAITIQPTPDEKE